LNGHVRMTGCQVRTAVSGCDPPRIDTGFAGLRGQ
jgi:hypothetical protein